MPTEKMDRFMSINKFTGEMTQLSDDNVTANQLRAREMLAAIPGTESQKAFAQLIFHYTGMASEGQMSGACSQMLAMCLATLATSLDFTQEMIDPICKVYEAAQEIGASDTPLN